MSVFLAPFYVVVFALVSITFLFGVYWVLSFILVGVMLDIIFGLLCFLFLVFTFGATAHVMNHYNENL